MLVKQLFLRILFIFSLFTLNGALPPKESEEFIIRYMSNYDRVPEVKLVLTNGGHSLVIRNDNYTGYLDTDVTLKDGFKPNIKTLALFIGSGDIRNREHVRCCDNDYLLCKEQWDKLVIQANGRDLYFYVVCLEGETNIEREYYFKVSAANLRKFIDSLIDFV
ncbi:hypothetical protein [Borrelia miyamotoi]|uniref:Uncharacterized protein n=1 Tax=Borrelia miyamotoi TaxID=47466 RepID=A0AAQ2WXJ8_9SPIR|nr:hypothetical protein [Borrelia miyamotoi]AOW96390.1 hypothetical protein AXH25_04455 [Borrelia miyamotoi]QTL84108.1 hypothetical protein bmLB2001_001185 [Borrelia miyamotoi]WAZ85729.1 hypothetical protein O5400_05105 [Borrelia miyamotoi]WAZ91511.1 hypothetical protein O5398_05095 [Borrelia miyamotoi]WAZ92799.1 hypothetical protein O5402_05105 [Borrelia miyamotoi]